VSLADVGKLSLVVVRNGDSVSATEIRSTRPMAAQILKGKTAAQVLQVVPLLFSVCGKAQGEAASAVLQAAQQRDMPASAAAMERMIACEAMQEHLWRLLLDWPKLLEMPQQEQRFARWYALLRKIGAGELDMADFRQEFVRDCLGMTTAEWQGIDSYSALQTWWRENESQVAQLLSALDAVACGRADRGSVRLLPAWSAAQANSACSGRWDAAFSAQPDWLGSAAETGAWAYHADDVLLCDVWQKTGSMALTRLLARVLDVVEMASGNAVARLDATSPAAGEGVAVVRTARGVLLHRVLLDGDKVVDYAIIAPTEWNFHSNGAFAQDMRGVVGKDEESLKKLAQIAALSLDPCVAYEVEIRNA